MTILCSRNGYARQSFFALLALVCLSLTSASWALQEDTIPDEEINTNSEFGPYNVTFVTGEGEASVVKKSLEIEATIACGRLFSNSRDLEILHELQGIHNCQSAMFSGWPQTTALQSQVFDALSEIEGLEEVYIGYLKLTDETIIQFAQLPHLKKLTICNDQNSLFKTNPSLFDNVGPEYFPPSLIPLDSSRTLRELRLVCFDLDTKTLNDLARISNLETLDISCSYLTDPLDLGEFENLRHLEICSSTIRREPRILTPGHASHLSSLEVIQGREEIPMSFWSQLTELDSLRSLTVSALPDQPEVLQGCEKLDTLTLRSSHVEEGILTLRNNFPRLQELTFIRNLALEGLRLSETELEWPRFTDLCSLEVWSPSPSDLEAIAGFTTLRKIHIVHADLSTKDIETLGRLSNLEEIRLHGPLPLNAMDDAWFRNFPQLKALSLECFSPYPESLSSLAECDQLKELHISGVFGENFDWSWLENLQQLESMSLRGGHVSPSLEHALSQLPKLRSLSFGVIDEQEHERVMRLLTQLHADVNVCWTEMQSITQIGQTDLPR
jgi:hypothetical protein